MRMGVVKGRVVLGAATSELSGTVLLIVEPFDSHDLLTRADSGSGKALVVADHLGSTIGQMVGFVEGREAANPYWPQEAPVDAYCSLIVDNLDYHPPQAANATS